MIDKQAFASIISALPNSASEVTGKVVLRGMLPPNFPLSREQLLQQLQSIFWAKRKLPDVVNSIEQDYENLKRKLLDESPSDYDPLCVQAAISNLLLSLQKQNNNNQTRKKNSRRLEELASWLQHLDQHQEDAVYLEHPVSYSALWFTQGRIFAIRHALRGAYSVVELDKTVARGLLTNRAFTGTRYHGEGFTVIDKYDRRETMECTTYVKIRKVGHGKWLAIDKDGHGANMSEAWARSTHNIPRVNYIDAVLRYKAGNSKPVPIIPGSYRPTDDAALDESEKEGLPLVEYRNKPGEHLCMVSALTSALHFLGYPEIAKRIHKDLGEEVVLGEDFVNWFLSCVANKNLLQYGMKLVKNDRRNRYNPNERACKGNEKNEKDKDTHRLVLGKLKGRKGGINHAVAFVNDELIFDANHERAMPMTKQSLDIACDGTGYHSLYWSYRLVMIK